METNEQNKILPTFSGSFSNGWKVLNKYFLALLLVVIALGVLVAPFQAGKININPGCMHWNNGHFDFFNAGLAALGMFALVIGIFAVAYSLLVVPIFEFGANLIFVHAVRDIKPQFETFIKGFKENYLHIVLANLLTIALVMMGFIFLIIPGIIIACRLAFVSYLVMDKKMDPIQAVEESWKLTKGHAWTIFFMAIVSFFICLLGLIMCFVGIFPAMIWVKSSFASLYEAVLVEKNAQSVLTE
jgi:uncharacterized membrane protein